MLEIHLVLLGLHFEKVSRVKYNFLKIIIFISLISNMAYAASASEGGKKLVLFELYGLFGFGAAKTATDISTPVITSANLGIGLGVNIRKFSLGVSFDYRSLMQTSDVEPTVGNRRGTFISPLSFFVKLNFDNVKFGLMLINSGKYDFVNTTTTGQTLSYTKPSGFRFNVNFKKINKVEPTVFYESVAFSEKELDGVPSAATNNLQYSNYGVGVRYGF